MEGQEPRGDQQARFPAASLPPGVRPAPRAAQGWLPASAFAAVGVRAPSRPLPVHPAQLLPTLQDASRLTAGLSARPGRPGGCRVGAAPPRAPARLNARRTPTPPRSAPLPPLAPTPCSSAAAGASRRALAHPPWVPRGKAPLWGAAFGWLCGNAGARAQAPPDRGHAGAQAAGAHHYPPPSQVGCFLQRPRIRSRGAVSNNPTRSHAVAQHGGAHSARWRQRHHARWWCCWRCCCRPHPNACQTTILCHAPCAISCCRTTHCSRAHAACPRPTPSG